MKPSLIFYLLTQIVYLLLIDFVPRFHCMNIDFSNREKKIKRKKKTNKLKSKAVELSIKFHLSPNAYHSQWSVSVVNNILLVSFLGIGRPDISSENWKQINKISLQCMFLCLIVIVLNLLPICLSTELAVWGECDNRRPSLHNLSCNSSVSAAKRQVWT